MILNQNKDWSVVILLSNNQTRCETRCVLLKKKTNQQKAKTKRRVQRTTTQQRRPWSPTTPEFSTKKPRPAAAVLSDLSTIMTPEFSTKDITSYTRTQKNRRNLHDVWKNLLTLHLDTTSWVWVLTRSSVSWKARVSTSILLACRRGGGMLYMKVWQPLIESSTIISHSDHSQIKVSLRVPRHTLHLRLLFLNE